MLNKFFEKYLNKALDEAADEDAFNKNYTIFKNIFGNAYWDYLSEKTGFRDKDNNFVSFQEEMARADGWIRWRCNELNGIPNEGEPPFSEGQAKLWESLRAPAFDAVFNNKTEN